MKLSGKVAVVTGAGQGIGAAISKRLARSGAMVALVDVKEAALTDLEKAILAHSEKALSFKADVSKKEDVTRAVSSICDRFGGVDILVNNAGIIRDNFLPKISESDWDEVINVNLKGAFLCCQAVVPLMQAKNSGKIVSIASRSWLGNIGQSNYCASKGGIVSLTRALALELAKDNINVNAVSPGLIDTPMTRKLPDKIKEKLIRMQPMDRMGSVDDIAAAVEFLVSDDSSFITGQVLHVDGGKSCGILAL